jgi:hypothetical protein
MFIKPRNKNTVVNDDRLSDNGFVLVPDVVSADQHHKMNPKAILDKPKSNLGIFSKTTFKISTWFVTSLLMTFVILGSVYSYFVVEDQRDQISFLEMNRGNSSQIKGVSEVVDDEGKSVVPETNTNLAKPAATGANVSFFQNSNVKAKFSFEEKETAINYFKDSFGNVQIFLTERTEENKQIKDGVYVYSVEKSESIDKQEILKVIQKEDASFNFDNRIVKSKNGVDLEVVSTPKSNKIRFLVGDSSTYHYVMAVYNQSYGQANQGELNNYMANISTNISLN